MIQYKNYLVTPSGKDCYLNTITNNQYFVLLKYTAAQDYQGFYEALDSLVKESIPDFDEFNILDKAYIYISECLYSIHNTITIEHHAFGNEIISLAMILNNFEQICTRLISSAQFPLTEKCIVEITLPTHIIFGHDNINIDYSTGLLKIKNFEFHTADEKREIFSSIDPKLAVLIENKIKKTFSEEFTLFKKTTVNLIREDLFYLIFQLYTENIEDYYKALYYYFEYLKWSYDTWCMFSPLESRILFNYYKEDKEKQAKEREEILNKNRRLR